LACIGNECTCVDSGLKWNPKMKMCLATEGERCGKVNLWNNSVTRGNSLRDPLYPSVLKYRNEMELPQNVYSIPCEEGYTCMVNPKGKSDSSRCVNLEE
jgi:hypothetical protein